MACLTLLNVKTPRVERDPLYGDETKEPPPLITHEQGFVWGSNKYEVGKYFKG